MALINECVEEKKFDVRMIEKNIARGRVTREELKKQLQNLPDDSALADYISLDKFFRDDYIFD